jgi:hypothetical protein
MISPLYPNLAPLTFSWGFLRAEFTQVREALHAWLRNLDAQCDIIDLNTYLEKNLQQLHPLTLPPTKTLLVATQSDWVGCFNNGANGADLLSHMSVLTDRLKCYGVVIRCVNDT